jgi:hypothetical protein
MTAKPRSILPSMREWYERNCAPTFVQKLSNEIVKSGGKVKVFTPATDLEKRAIKALASITFCPGIPTKRFARHIQGADQLTDSQREYLWGIIHKFRRQVADAELVNFAAERKNNGATNVAI